MILGSMLGACAKEPHQSAEAIVPAAPVVVDTAPIRCAEPDITEFRKTTPRPEPDITAGELPALSKEATRKWIDTLEGAERTKNAAGLRIARDLQSCRGQVNSRPAVASK